MSFKTEIIAVLLLTLFVEQSIGFKNRNSGYDDLSYSMESQESSSESDEDRCVALGEFCDKSTSCCVGSCYKESCQIVKNKSRSRKVVKSRKQKKTCSHLGTSCELNNECCDKQCAYVNENEQKCVEFSWRNKLINPKKSKNYDLDKGETCARTGSYCDASFECCSVVCIEGICS
ncbi:hypothetical protein M3Y97_00680600 [Aphelenchoides bicaudatus]|nr:hypothetical protein M3Y97_00680600 [Aphelenchoides bicaudatus]